MLPPDDRQESEPDPDNAGNALTPSEKAALEALFSEPFPQKPYALVPANGSSTPEYTDYLIHKDIGTENQCIFLFDSIVDALGVAEEYKEATGRDAEPVECDVYSLEERFWVKYYRANGVVVMMPVTDYRTHIGVRYSYE
ncbi:MAG: hypothetical protein SFU56_10500 [Capsulimonadales bacterium]|nr:hypothetical protein [Capsulimonadales bacterium]